jgi:aryl-alcohol dehydrogenase-like predicted oxidoreductase
MATSDTGLPRVELAPGITIPRLIRGTWQLHETAAKLDRAVTLAELMATFDLGFTAIEASDSYHGVEDLLGALRDDLHRTRGAAAAASLRVHTRVSQIGAAPMTPAMVRAGVDAARRRLRQERLDLVQLQWWNLALPGWLEAGHELARLQREGAIAAIGVTNFPTAEMCALLDAGVPVASNQVQMSLLDPRAKLTLVPAARARGVHLFGYGPIAGGFLSEAWLNQPEPGLEPTAERPFGTVYRRLVDRFGGWAWLQDLLRVLAERGRQHDTDIATMGLAWILGQSGATALLVGISSTRRAAAYVKATQVQLDADDIAAIQAVLARRPPIVGDIADMERAELLALIAAADA